VLAGSSQAVAVEIPDDDSPPPGWHQWVNFPMPSPEPQDEGALVRRWDGHMVAGGRGHGAEASSSRAGRSASGGGRVDGPPAFADAEEEQELWGKLRDHGAADSWRSDVARLPGEAPLSISFGFVVFMLVPSGATLTGFGLLVVGA
jgi:hypothetical protein